MGSSSGERFYDVTVAETKFYTFSTCSGSDYDTWLRLFSGDYLAGTVLSNNDDDCGLQSVVRHLLEPGNYTVVVEGFASHEGNYRLDVNCYAAPTVAPTVSPTVILDNRGFGEARHHKTGGLGHRETCGAPIQIAALTCPLRPPSCDTHMGAARGSDCSGGRAAISLSRATLSACLYHPTS